MAAAEEFRPDVALLDPTLPGLNGLDAFHRIQEELALYDAIARDRDRDEFGDEYAMNMVLASEGC